MTCFCVEWNPANTGVRQCPEHFRIWKGSTRLTSVGRIIHASFPLDPGIPPTVLENARERGAEADQLLASYCRGELKAIPVGTRMDSVALFEKARAWFDRQNFRNVEVQILLGDTDHGGVLDFRFDSVSVDLKCTSKVEQTARLQVAGYACLSGVNEEGYVLHVTARNAEARLIPLKHEDFDDWHTLLAYWRMTNRRNPKRTQENSSEEENL